MKKVTSERNQDKLPELAPEQQRAWQILDPPTIDAIAKLTARHLDLRKELIEAFTKPKND